MSEFELGPINVPVEATEEALNDMREEINSLKEWFQNSTRSIDLVKESSERILTPSEASSIVMDFVRIAMIASHMAQRNEMVIKTATQAISESTAPQFLKNIEEMLKGD